MSKLFFILLNVTAAVTLFYSVSVSAIESEGRPCLVLPTAEADTYDRGQASMFKAKDIMLARKMGNDDQQAPAAATDKQSTARRAPVVNDGGGSWCKCYGTGACGQEVKDGKVYCTMGTCTDGCGRPPAVDAQDSSVAPRVEPDKLPRGRLRPPAVPRAKN